MSALKDGETFAAEEGIASRRLGVGLLFATEIMSVPRATDGGNAEMLLAFQRSLDRRTARCSFLLRPVG